MHNDGGIEVNGVLMDLDGPHEIHETFPGPTVSFTVRQYIDPGVEFSTYADHGQFFEDPVGNDIYTENYGPTTVAGGVVGYTFAESKHLKAFIGSP